MICLICTDIGIVANHHGVDAMVPPRLWGRADQLRPRCGRAATAPPRTSDPRARSTAFPRPEDSDQGFPAPRTDSSRRRSYLDTDPDHCQTATRQLPTRSPGDAAVPGGIPQWPLAPDTEPERGPAWASTAALPVSPTRVDSPENESRDRTTHVGFDRSVVVRLLHLLHQDLAVLRPSRQDRIVAHEARAILDHQDAVAELERLRNFATDDQLSVRLEQTEEFFAVVDPFPLEHTPSSQVTDMNGHIYVISQFLLEHVYSGRSGAGSDGDQSGVEQLQRSGQNPIGQVQERPVAVLKPLGKVAPLALGDLVDRTELFLHGPKQVLALPPTAEAEKSRQAHRQRHDRA